MIKKIYTVILLLACLSAFAQDGDPVLFPVKQSFLSCDSILIGDQIEWTFPLEMKSGDRLYLETPSDPVTYGVETIDPLHIDTVAHKKNKLNVEGRMTITSFDSGSYYLPNLLAIITRADGSEDTLLFDGPSFAVNTIPVDTANYVIKEIKGQMKYPVTIKEAAVWFGLVILLAALIYFIIRFIKTRKENRTFFGKPIVKDPPHIVALRSLDKIHKQKLWQNSKQKQFYTAVTDTLRIYIADRFNIVTLERPSGEMLSDLKKENIDSKLFDEVSDLFARADLVKFAKYDASNEENEETIPLAVKFVNSSYQSEIEKSEEEK